MEIDDVLRAYKDLKYTLKRSARKTVSIQIAANGEVSLRVPKRVSIRQVENFIAEKTPWIDRKRLEFKERRQNRRPEPKYQAGERFTYLGRSYALAIVQEQDEALILKQGCFQLRSDHRSTFYALTAFKIFYQEKGLKHISARVRHFQKIMGVEAQRIRMVETRTRWASCSSKGNLNFHWKCLMLPSAVLDYIVVHELGHLIHMDHSSRFWFQVEKIMPDFDDHRIWLKTEGAEIEL